MNAFLSKYFYVHEPNYGLCIGVVLSLRSRTSARGLNGLKQMFCQMGLRE